MANFEINITYDCDLACKWCNRLCGTKLNKPDHLTVPQAKKYFTIISNNIEPHSKIIIIGGEPTLHPQLFEILDLAVEIIRPKLVVPLLIRSHGIGEVVPKILQQIKERYTVSESRLFGDGLPGLSEFLSTSTQFIIERSDMVWEGYKAYIERQHDPIFRAAIDLNPNCDDYSKMCKATTLNRWGVTPYGIFRCSHFGPSISRIFKLGPGFDHMPTDEELAEHKKKICKYCPWTGTTKYKKNDPGPAGLIITESYKKALAEWNRDPYFLPLVNL